MIDYFDWLGILEEGEKVELSKKESSLIIDIEQKRLVGKLNKELTKIDFKKYANSEQITGDELLKMDEKVECSEDLTNQEIFDLATHKEVPEEVIEQVKTDQITNKEARYFIDKLFSYFEQNDFTEEDLLDLNKIKAKIENKINVKLTQKKIVDVFSKVNLNKN